MVGNNCGIVGHKVEVTYILSLDHKIESRKIGIQKNAAANGVPSNDSLRSSVKKCYY